MALVSGIKRLFLRKGNPMSDVRDTYIGQVVAGKSFADVGGLWGTVNEKVSVAHTHGARALTMIDISPTDSDLWTLFEQRRRTLRLPTVECVSGDLLTLAQADSCPQFDVVHCSGVLLSPTRADAVFTRLTQNNP